MSSLPIKFEITDHLRRGRRLAAGEELPSHRAWASGNDQNRSLLTHSGSSRPISSGGAAIVPSHAPVWFNVCDHMREPKSEGPVTTLLVITLSDIIKLARTS